jgi:hypothetical protein
MQNVLRRAVRLAAAPLVALGLLASVSTVARAQSAIPKTPFEKQLDRFDFGVSAAGMLSDTVSGTQQRDHTPMSLRPSSTVGEIATLRYFGLEYNFSNVRLTENYTSAQNILPGGAQTGLHENTFGYVAHPRWKPFGIQPFFGVGAGFIKFHPTPYGGQGLPQQYRMAYYYHAGAEANFPDSHFGVRVAFRQLIYLGPDFGQNYLTITRRIRTTDPTVGFFVRF